VPEVVECGDLLVGRFEITCAQYAQFDADHACPAEGPNFPVTDVSFDQAQAYVAWLAKMTGRPFRLPTVAEAERLALSAGDGGNTLDAWAGYAPNPEDLDGLLTAVAALPGEASLLLAVGSGSGSGEPTIFDLNGNASEWAIGDDGQGEPVGASADRPRAKRNRVRDVGREYQGFRVVIGDVAPPDDE
jgi:formylglycine-generating enzyme required for sulfatase activity